MAAVDSTRNEFSDNELERQPILEGDSNASSAYIVDGVPQSNNTLTARPGISLKDPLVSQALKNLMLIAIWYFFSTVLSLWNKILVGKDHGLFGKGAFPAPFLMSSFQFFCQHLIARTMLATGFVERKVDEQMSWRKYFRTVVPNGIATGLDIGFSNYSLVFITLSFYVMCKSTTPLFLLSFAIGMGLEKPSWGLAAVVSTISVGLLLLVAGETKFHLGGFILVMSAAALAGLRWTITQILLQGSKHHAATGGPIEVIYHLTPIMGLTLGTISLAFERLWITLPPSPYFNSPAHAFLTLGIMLFGGIIAFSMVWAEFMLISNTSALTFMVAGTLKEIVTVGAAVLFLHERFTAVNAMGLVVLVLGVVMFNGMKYQKLKQGEIRPIPVDDSLRGGNVKFESEAVSLNGGGAVNTRGSDVNLNSLAEGLELQSAASRNSSRPSTPTSPGFTSEALSRRLSGGIDVRVVEDIDGPPVKVGAGLNGTRTK